MALYAIGDLHLCLGAPKPMDIFGGAWVGYMDKLKDGLSVIRPEDTTVLLGDLSWALDLSGAKADFAWINAIPGRNQLGHASHRYPQGFRISAAAARPEAHHEGQSRLLVEHGGKVPKILPGKWLWKPESSEQ